MIVRGNESHVKHSRKNAEKRNAIAAGTSGPHRELALEKFVQLESWPRHRQALTMAASQACGLGGSRPSSAVGMGAATAQAGGPTQSAVWRRRMARIHDAETQPADDTSGTRSPEKTYLDP